MTRGVRRPGVDDRPRWPQSDGALAPDRLSSEGLATTIGSMANIRVRVENGKIIGDAPPGFEEGAEIELALADPGDDLSHGELARLNQALEAAWKSVRDGHVRPAGDVLADLRSRK